MFDSTIFIKSMIKRARLNDTDSENFGAFIKQFYNGDIVLDADEVKKVAEDTCINPLKINIGEDNIAISSNSGTGKAVMVIRNDKNGTEICIETGTYIQPVPMLMKISNDKEGVKSCVTYDGNEIKAYNKESLQYVKNVDVCQGMPEYIKPDAIKKLNEETGKQPEVIASELIIISHKIENESKKLTKSPQSPH